MIILTSLNKISAQEDYHFLYTGISLVKKVEYAAAIENYNKYIVEYPDNYFAYMARGDAYYEMEKYDLAINDYKKAQNLKYNIADFKIAEAYAFMQMVDSSIFFLTKNLETTDKVLKTEILCSDAFAKIEDHPDWKTFIKKDLFYRNDLLLSDANYKLQQEKYIEALDILNQLIKKNKRNHRAIVMKAAIFEKTNDYKTAVKMYKQALKISPKNNEYRKKLAEAEIIAEDYKSALQNINLLLEENASDIFLFQARAKANLGEKNFDQALQDIKLFGKYFEHDLETILLEAKILFASQEYLETIKILNRLIAEPEYEKFYATFYAMRGECFLNTYSYELAINDFAYSLDLNPEQAETHIGYGLAKKALGDDEGACQEWHKAIEKGCFKANNYIFQNCKNK